MIEVDMSQCPTWEKVRNCPKHSRHKFHGLIYNEARKRLERHAGIGNVIQWWPKENLKLVYPENNDTKDRQLDSPGSEIAPSLPA